MDQHNTTSYCHGGRAMGGRGFGGNGDTCMIWLFQSAVMISKDNYIGCVVASFLLGLGSEGIRFLRGKVKEMKETAVINVEGMTCNACVQSIEGRVGERAGVFSIKVSLEEGTATIKHDASAETTETLCDAIDDMGFDATAADPEERCHNLGSDTLVAVLFALQMMVAYCLMLVIMIYDVYIFSAVIAGLCTGHFLILRSRRMEKIRLLEEKRKAITQDHDNAVQ